MKGIGICVTSFTLIVFERIVEWYLWKPERLDIKQQMEVEDD